MKRVVKPSFNQHEVNLYAQTYNSRAYKQATYIAVFSCNTSKYNAGRVNTECDRECTCHPVTKHKGRLLADWRSCSCQWEGLTTEEKPGMKAKNLICVLYLIWLSVIQFKNNKTKNIRGLPKLHDRVGGVQFGSQSPLCSLAFDFLLKATTCRFFKLGSIFTQKRAIEKKLKKNPPADNIVSRDSYILNNHRLHEIEY